MGLSEHYSFKNDDDKGEDENEDDYNDGDDYGEYDVDYNDNLLFI